MKKDEKTQYYKDHLGRGWQVIEYIGSKRCFRVKCRLRGTYDVSRVTAYGARRETLCYRCFWEFRDKFKLKEQQIRFEKD